MTGQGDKRACKWCGGGMEGKRSVAVFCSKKCCSAKYNKVNPEVIAERAREYSKANAEQIAERKREWRKANLERICERERKYRKANAEVIVEKQRKYNIANAERYRTRYSNNAEVREQAREYQREYRNINAERIAESKREYKNTLSAAASALSLAHTISQTKGDLSNGTHEPE